MRKFQAGAGLRLAVGCASVVACVLAAPVSAAAITASVSGDNKMVVSGGAGTDQIILGAQLLESKVYYSVTNNENFPNGKVNVGAGCVNSTAVGGDPGAVYCPSSVTGVSVSLGGGADNVSAWCQQRHIADPQQIDGEGGNDTIGSQSTGPRVTLIGGGGKDVMGPSGCADDQFQTYRLTERGGDQADILQGHCGTDDDLFGQDGDDSFLSKDGVEDLVNGGPGTDRANLDGAKDVRKSVESTFQTSSYC